MKSKGVLIIYKCYWRISIKMKEGKNLRAQTTEKTTFFAQTNLNLFFFFLLCGNNFGQGIKCILHSNLKWDMKNDVQYLCTQYNAHK